MRNPFTTSRAKTAPSHYPRLPFHGFRALQLLSSLIVGGIMAYFTYHLAHDHYDEPWTFILLFAASLASIAALAVTIFLHCLLGLNPRLNLAINSGLAVLWGVTFALLTWWMSGPTLAAKCDIEHWNEDVGVMVCRIYKALWSFTLIGFAATLAALFLDIYVRRAQISRGMYRLPDLNDSKNRPVATRGPFTEDEDTAPYGQGGLAAPRHSDVWEEPRLSMGPYEERVVMRPEPSQEAVFGRFGNTEYHGVHDEGLK